MPENDIEPEDLEVRIGTKRHAQFEKILRQQEETILTSQINAEICTAVKEYCQKKILEEKAILEEQKKNQKI